VWKRWAGGGWAGSSVGCSGGASISRRASTSASSRRSPTATTRSRRRSRRSVSSSPAESIAAEARRESPLWALALRDEPDWEPVFSPLAPASFELGLETVYEAYLVHYGRPRLFEPDRDSERILPLH